MIFKTMDICDKKEGVSFMVLRHGNDAADVVIQQVQWFEGSMYPDAMGFAANWDDRITDAVGWCDMPNYKIMETIEIRATPA